MSFSLVNIANSVVRGRTWRTTKALLIESIMEKYIVELVSDRRSVRVEAKYQAQLLDGLVPIFIDVIISNLIDIIVCVYVCFFPIC